MGGRPSASIQLRSQKPIHARGVTERQSDGRARPPAAGQSPAPAEAVIALARIVVDLVIFPENRLQLLLGNTNAGVPDLDGELAVPLPQPMRILPRWVYFSAFEIRFRIICSSRRGSDRIVREDLTTRSSSFCNWAFGRKSSRIRFSRSLTGKLISCGTTTPASI